MIGALNDSSRENLGSTEGSCVQQRFWWVRVSLRVTSASAGRRCDLTSSLAKCSHGMRAFCGFIGLWCSPICRICVSEPPSCSFHILTKPASQEKLEHIQRLSLPHLEKKMSLFHKSWTFILKKFFVFDEITKFRFQTDILQMLLRRRFHITSFPQTIMAHSLVVSSLRCFT